MAQRFEVVLVSPKEYEAVAASNPRYQHVLDEENPSLSFYDPQEEKIFVPNTGWPKLTEYLLSHELSHAIEEHATHEDEFGVRHKKFFKEVLNPIRQTALKVASVALAPVTGGLSLLAPVIGDVGTAAMQGQRGLGRVALQSYGANVLAPGAGGAAGAALGGGALGNAVGSGVGSSAGALAQGASPGQAALAGGLGGLGSFITQGMTPGSQTTKTSLSSGGQSAASVSPSPSISSFSPASTGGGSIGKASLRNPNLLGISGGGGPRSIVGPGGAPSAYQPFQGTPGASSSFAPAAAAGLGSFLGASAANQFSSQPSQAPTQPSLTAQLTGGTPASSAQPMAPPVSAPPAGAAAQAAQTTPQSLQSQLAQGVAAIQKSLGINVGQLAAGAALTGFGQTAGPETPSVPDLSEAYRSALTDPRNLETLQGAQSPLAKLAQTRLSEQLSSPYGGISPDVRSGIKRQFDQLRSQMTSQYKIMVPNADIATDSNYRQIMTNIDQQEAETAAKLEMQDKQTFTTNRQSDIQQALGIDKQSMDQLSQLAQLSVQELVVQYGMDAQRAAEFKTMFGSLGGQLISRGLGLNNFNSGGQSSQSSQIAPQARTP